MTTTTMGDDDGRQHQRAVTAFTANDVDSKATITNTSANNNAPSNNNNNMSTTTTTNDNTNTPAYSPINSSMANAKAEQICRIFSEPIVDLWKLRELALTEGGLINGALNVRI